MTDDASLSPALTAAPGDHAPVFVEAYDGTVLYVADRWSKDIVERAAEQLARHYLGLAAAPSEAADE